MSKRDLESYRQELLAMLRRMDRDLTEQRHEALPGTGGETVVAEGLRDPADRGSHETEEDLTLTIVKQEEHVMAEIVDALERVEKGTFGRCEKCGRDIPTGRLDVLPYARYCMPCAQEIEASGP